MTRESMVDQTLRQVARIAGTDRVHVVTYVGSRPLVVVRWRQKRRRRWSEGSTVEVAVRRALREARAVSGASS